MSFNNVQYQEWLEQPVWYWQLPIGAKVDLVNPPSLHGYDVFCQAICLTVTSLLVLVRVYTKVHVLKSMAWDDCTTVLIS